MAIITGTAKSETLNGTVDNDTLSGLGGNDILVDGIGDDLLDGGTGNDTLKGGVGNDTYIVNVAGDVIEEEGIDTGDRVRSSISINLTALAAGLIENATLLGAAAINATGNGASNDLVGNGGANQLDGKGGADTMAGGNGADTYFVDDLGDVVTETNAAAAGGIDIVKSSVSFILGPNIENLTLTGTGNIDGTGNGLKNAIVGNSGNNRLDGLGGADKMTGAAGDDTYVVDNAGDQVVEIAKGGTDTIESSITFSLKALINVENLTLTGAGNINGTGNGLVNHIIGNSGNNTLDGGTGADDLTGGAGNDTFNVDQFDAMHEGVGEGTDLVKMTATASEIIFDMNTTYQNVENFTLLGKLSGHIDGNSLNNVLIGNGAKNAMDGNDGNDMVTGGAGNDNLFGADGDDTLTGGTGVDVMKGGAGNDTYFVDNIGDKVSGELSGIDHIFSTVSVVAAPGIEFVTLQGTANVNVTGCPCDNTIIGNSGANILDGADGLDKLSGGAGNDTYVMHDLLDTIDESIAGTKGGVDQVKSEVSFDISSLLNIENLTLFGVGDLDGTGNSLKNVITGNSGNNRLNGLGGADKMTGGTGDDTYVVDALADTIVENAKSGTDTVESSITFSLAALINVENLTLTGSGNINGTGNALANHIIGNLGNNTLIGGIGNDTLDGAGGNDILTGGTGVDDLTGGIGNDTFNVDQLDIVHEGSGEGVDLVKMTSTVANLTFDMTTKYQNVDNFTLLGALAGNVTGNDLDNAITGNGASNTLDGGTGKDTLHGGIGIDTLNGGIDEDFLDGGAGKDKMAGGAGNDTYVIETAGDAIDEGINTDTGDLVRTSLTVNLTTLGGGAIENAVLVGATAINATGNAVANDLTGNNAGNVLDGGSGNDTLSGGAGNDTLTGGTDDDFLHGGAGKDSMTGGAGSDTFHYASVAEGNAGERILDFTKGGGGDVLDLQDLLDGLPGYDGTNAFTGGFLQLQASGGNTNVRLDANGGGDSFVTLVVLNNVTLTEADTGNLLL